MIPSPAAWARASSRRIAYAPAHAPAHAYPRPQNRRHVPGNITQSPCQTSPSHVIRRCNATKPPSSRPVGQKPPETATTIPGPAWLWLEPVIEPFRAYGRVQQRKPYVTQLVSSLVIYFVGDLVAQSIVAPGGEKEDGEKEKEKEDGGEKEEGEGEERGWVQQWSEDRDWARTGRALVIGGISSIPSYRWFVWLSQNFNYSSKILSLTTKVVVNQLLFTPLFNSYFFGMQTLLAGASLAEITERIKNTVPTSWINSCKLWPAVTAFSFTYVPIQYRSIFGGVIAIGWQTYLSLLNQRAAALEHTELEGDVRHVEVVGVEKNQRERVGQKDECAA